MKSLRNKIILSGLVLLFALVATIGSTFAWFTVSNTVTVAALDLNVTTSESLLIKVYNGETGSEAALTNAANYKANLTQADVLAATTAGYNALASWVLTPVTDAQEVAPSSTSTAYTAINGLNLNTMNIDTKVLTATSTSNSASGNFIELKFWLLSQTTDENIVLQDLVITSATNNSDPQDAVANAISVAVYKAADGATAVGSPTANVYSPSPDYAFAFTTGMRGYDLPAGSNTVGTPQTLIDLHSLYYNGAAVADVSAATLATATTIAAVTTNVPALFAVRIYLEGWDSATTNAILAADFSISFKFSIKNA